MNTLILQNGVVRTGLAEIIGGDGVAFVQGPDYVTLNWDEAIRVRDWLQLAIAERTERLAREVSDVQP